MEPLGTIRRVGGGVVEGRIFEERIRGEIIIRRRRTVAPQPLLPVARILAESCRWINTARLGVYKVVMAPIGGQGEGRLRAAGLLSPQHYSDSEPSEKDCRQSGRRQRCQSHVQTSLTASRKVE